MLVQIELDELNRLVNIEKGLKIASDIIDDAIKETKQPPLSGFRARLDKAMKDKEEAKRQKEIDTDDEDSTPYIERD